MGVGDREWRREKEFRVGVGGRGTGRTEDDVNIVITQRVRAFADGHSLAFAAHDMLALTLGTILAALGADAPHRRAMPRGEAAGFVAALAQRAVTGLGGAHLLGLCVADHAARDALAGGARTAALAAQHLRGGLGAVDLFAVETGAQLLGVTHDPACVAEAVGTIHHARQVTDNLLVLGREMRLAILRRRIRVGGGGGVGDVQLKRGVLRRLDVDHARVNRLARQMALGCDVTAPRGAGDAMEAAARKTLPATHQTTCT